MRFQRYLTVGLMFFAILLVLWTNVTPVPAYNLGDENWWAVGGTPLNAFAGDLMGPVTALAVDQSNGILYAGGDSIIESGGYTSNLAKWDGSTWTALPRTIGNIATMVVDDSGNLYIGGAFQLPPSSYTYTIAKWDGSSMVDVGGGVTSGGRHQDAIVRAVLLVGGDIYIGGMFDMAGEAEAYGVARWDGSAWSAVGSFPWQYNEVMALAMDSSGNLYAGGGWWYDGCIAKWDGSNWSILGGGMSGPNEVYVFALAADGVGNLYASGLFTEAGGVNANNIAHWDGSAWSALGNGLAGMTQSPLILDGVGNLYVGATAKDYPEYWGAIAKWDGANWSNMGSGLGGGALLWGGGFAIYGNSLYVGSESASAGDRWASFIASWGLGPRGLQPGASTLVSPSGIITTKTPTYTWNAVPGADGYSLWVIDSTIVQPCWECAKFTRRYSAKEAGCGSGTGTCSVTPRADESGGNPELALGPALWVVQTKTYYGQEGPGAPGPWSNPNSFSVTLAPPQAATLISPSGTITTTTPTYSWYAVSDATSYRLYVNDSSGNTKVDQWYTAAQAGCGSGTGTCSVTPSTALAAGDGKWWVQTANSSGNGPWSDSLSFTVRLAPRATTLISPSGAITTTTPAYTWNAVSNSTWYYLWVNDILGNKIKQWYAAAQAGCGSGAGICSVTPGTALAAGSGKWWVQTWNSDGTGPWSDGMVFTVPAPALPGKATLVSPSGTIGTSTPTYTWNADLHSSWYYLWVGDSTGTKISAWYTTAQANCASGTGTCSVTPTTALAAGQGRWWVQTWNANGTGPWSDGMVFTVPGPALPGKATLVSPSGAISTTTPTYTWNAVSSSTWYYLWVSDSTGGKINQWYTAAQAGCGSGAGTCSVSPSIALAQGSCSWWIQTYGNAGNGPWSSRMDFTVSGQSIQPPTLYTPPNGSVQYQDTVYFSWSASSEANNYHLQISHDEYFTSLIFDQDVGNETGGDVSELFQYGCTYYWRVRAGNGSTWSGWSAVWWFK